MALLCTQILEEPWRAEPSVGVDKGLSSPVPVGELCVPP